MPPSTRLPFLLAGIWATSVLAVAGPSLAGAQQPLPVQRVLVIGDSTGASSPGFGLIGGVAVSADRSEVYVVELDAGPIRVFDLSGTPLRSFGTRGEGPGGFVNAIRLWTTPEGIHVGDHRTGEVTSFSEAGEVLGRRGTPQPSPPPWVQVSDVPRPVRYDQSITTWAPKAGSGTRPAAEMPVRELLVDGSGEVVVELAAFPPGSARWAWTRRPDDLNLLLNLRTLPSTAAGRGGASVVVGDSVYVFVDSYTGAVSWSQIERGGVVEMRSRDLGWMPLPLGFDEHEAALAIHEERGFPLAEIEVFLPPWRSRVAGFTVASNQDVWVRVRNGQGLDGPDGGQEWLIVPFAEEEPPRHVTLPDGFALRGVTGELIFGTRREGGRVTVEVYRIDG